MKIYKKSIKESESKFNFSRYAYFDNVYKVQMVVKNIKNNNKRRIEMKNNLTLLKDGKILVWGGNFPRYYKLEGEDLLWSDNLKEWHKSQQSVMFICDFDLKEYK